MSDERPYPHLLRRDAISAGESTVSHPWNPNSEITGTHLSALAGLKRTGVSLVRIAAGKESFAYHLHHREEEWIMPEQRKWYEHPLANVLVGFLLTGVLGTALTQHFMDRREREKLRAQAALDRKEVVVTLSELLAAIQYHGELLAEAIETVDSADVIKERMLEYEASYEAWRIHRGSALLLARDLMSEEDYRGFNDFVHRRLQERTLEPLRECLLEVYSASKKDSPVPTDITCDLDTLMQRSGRCSGAVVEALYVFAEASVSRSGDPGSGELDSMRQHVDEACP